MPVCVVGLDNISSQVENIPGHFVTMCDEMTGPRSRWDNYNSRALQPELSKDQQNEVFRNDQMQMFGTLRKYCPPNI